MMAFSAIDASLAESDGKVDKGNHPHRHQLRKRSVSILPRSYYKFRKQMKNEKWKKSTENNMDNKNDVELHTPDDKVAPKLSPIYT